jgi:glyoxylase-like metal-dependent hydrolase (beta-lactamase superfamily II)
MNAKTDTPREVAPSVHRLGTRFVNWYVVAVDGRLTVIDSGLRGYTRPLDDDLRALDATRNDVEAVVLTHADGDHMGMAATFAEAGARILIHEADEQALCHPSPKGGDARLPNMMPFLRRPGFVRFVAHLVARGWGRPVPPTRVEVFEDGSAIDVPGRPRALHTPGHTRGHCALLLAERGVVFTGDALSTWDPFTGKRGPRLMSRPAHFDSDQAAVSFERLRQTEAELLLPGHGDPWRR